MSAARWIGAMTLASALACGGEEAKPAAPESPRAEAEPPAVQAHGDPLLARARESIRAGRLPDEVEAEVLGSTAPEHARARRVLLAMHEPADADGGEPEAPPPTDTEDGPPPILPPAESAPPPVADTSPRVSGGTKTKPPAVPRPKGGSARLGTLAMRTSKRGAVLTIAAPSSLVVGVANQPSSGIVRLVIESAKAGAAVLTARPKVEGAAVTGVRQGQGTVQVTVRLDAGWSLGKVVPFSGGAKVHLVAPR